MPQVSASLRWRLPSLSLREVRVELLQVRLDVQDRLRVNLADARFGEAEDFGDFAQAHVFEVVEREDFALHLGKLAEPLGNQARYFAAESAVHWVFLLLVRKAFVLGQGIIGIVVKRCVET